MLVVNRFRVPESERPVFEGRAQAAVELFRTKPGLQSADLVQNLDDPELWAIVTHWDQVGSYRRALGGFESKMTIVPLLSLAIDEPSAYADPADVGSNRPRGFHR
ncbi:antibiotic biosynthesis monooxygenase [Aestuariimicrobium sp. p3-SID1156]|uniref:antibiotic biosynthesis monooxygenase family protein n=1 Tax=Aestuariimicrobium sp. p3-SID1156 TaxID=2916038 RepID=UPI00223ACFEC|nr:antibiotic biosynthesis monooxygenase family protein [Aestuariimicrobium sp. p3-SID1156]MCT1459284.1 antibiotic biosynthesis monooxygenase [Aestuariimicrobium sp. p3-SID1156]